jgi:hypothetical protein
VQRSPSGQGATNPVRSKSPIFPANAETWPASGACQFRTFLRNNIKDDRSNGLIPNYHAHGSAFSPDRIAMDDYPQISLRMELVAKTAPKPKTMKIGRLEYSINKHSGELMISGRHRLDEDLGEGSRGQL